LQVETEPLPEFAAKGEVGLKAFVARNVSFEVAYNLLCAHIAHATFKESTDSMIVFGFALTF
jgi:ubiquinone biosynthesis protein Coq4